MTEFMKAVKRNVLKGFRCQLGATVGIKYSKQFALNKQAQKVKYVATDLVAEEPETPSGGGSNGNGGGGTPGELEG